MSAARVALVGGGPGDPGLLTLRAEAVLGSAGVVLADAGLVLLAQALAPGEVVAVPERRPATAALLEAAARATRPVVRLYRGDPWLHPAHAAERAALLEAGIAAESIAGVAIEVAVPARAGVPVHVRRLAVACTLGPFEGMPSASDPARTLVAAGDDTEALARAVAAAGDGCLPAALIAVSGPQGAWRGPLAQAPERAAAMAGPALLVVGAVCAAHPGPTQDRETRALGAARASGAADAAGGT